MCRFRFHLGRLSHMNLPHFTKKSTTKRWSSGLSLHRTVGIKQFSNRETGTSPDAMKKHPVLVQSFPNLASKLLFYMVANTAELFLRAKYSENLTNYQKKYIFGEPTNMIYLFKKLKTFSTHHFPEKTNLNSSSDCALTISNYSKVSGFFLRGLLEIQAETSLNPWSLNDYARVRKYGLTKWISKRLLLRQASNHGQSTWFIAGSVTKDNNRVTLQNRLKSAYLKNRKQLISQQFLS